MGTVYLRSTAAPDGTYLNRNATLSHADMDNNLVLFLRNDVDDTFNGTLTVTGDLNSQSDVRKKTEINIVDGNLIHSLDGVEFKWIENNVHSAGVIAQQVEEIIPHLVSTDKNNFKNVNYNGLIAYLIEAVKNQQKQINELKTELNNKVNMK